MYREMIEKTKKANSAAFMISVPIAAVLLLMIIVLEFYMLFGDKTYFGISKEEKPLAVAVMLPFIVLLGKFVIKGFISSVVQNKYSAGRRLYI